MCMPVAVACPTRPMFIHAAPFHVHMCALACAAGGCSGSKSMTLLPPLASHLFHAHCIDHWLTLNASCPVCKTAIGRAGSGTMES